MDLIKVKETGGKNIIQYPSSQLYVVRHLVNREYDISKKQY
jgi:hypothetical protein